MIKKYIISILSLVLFCFAPKSSFSQCTTMPTTKAELADCNFEIALKFAPEHRQSIDDDGSHGLNGKSDYITAINFDGDWVCDNNWENLDENSNSQYRAHVYYSVVWTKTHWYIVYGYFHPRDWTNSNNDGEHENDLEGILVVVRRSGANVIDLNSAVLEAGVTVFHSDFYSYTTSNSSFTDGEEDIDGDLNTVGSTHPITAQEDEGHGCKAWPEISYDDGMVTYKSNSANIAEYPTSNDDNDVKYKLVDIFEDGGLWSRRNHSSTFAEWGKFNGDNYGTNKAHAPWRWDDSNDGPTYYGEMATDPAHLVDHYFNSTYSISDCYQFLPYDCVYYMSASQNAVCNGKEVSFSIHRTNSLPLNTASVHWGYSSSFWECVSGCGDNDPTITLRATSNFSSAKSVSALINTIDCGLKSFSKDIDPGFNCAVAAFQIEDGSGAFRTVFCPGEDIYMDGTASQNETSYYIDVRRRLINSSNNFAWYGDLNWTQGQVGAFNLSQDFLPMEFTPGYEYEVRLWVNNSTTDWVIATRYFTVLNSCCKAPINVDYNCMFGRIDWDLDPFGNTPNQFIVRVSWNDPSCCGPGHLTKSNQWTTTNQYFYLPFINISNCFSVTIGSDCGDGAINWSNRECSGCKKHQLKLESPIEAVLTPELHPNPTQGMVNLSLQAEKDLSIQVEAYDMQGRLIKSLAEQFIPDGKFEAQLQLDASLPRGVYLILFRTNYGTFQKKLILQ